MFKVVCKSSFTLSNTGCFSTFTFTLISLGSTFKYSSPYPWNSYTCPWAIPFSITMTKKSFPLDTLLAWQTWHFLVTIQPSPLQVGQLIGYENLLLLDLLNKSRHKLLFNENVTFSSTFCAFFKVILWFSPRSSAMGAKYLLWELDLNFFAIEYVLKLNIHFKVNIRPFGCLLHITPEIHITTLVLVLDTLLPASIILLSLFIWPKHLIHIINLLVLLSCFGIPWVLVRMELEWKLFIGLFDLFLSRLSLYTKNLVVVFPPTFA